MTVGEASYCSWPWPGSRTWASWRLSVLSLGKSNWFSRAACQNMSMLAGQSGQEDATCGSHPAPGFFRWMEITKSGLTGCPCLSLRPTFSIVETSPPYSSCHSKAMLVKLLATDLGKEGHPVTGEPLSTSPLVTVFPKVVAGSSSSSSCSTPNCRGLETKWQLGVWKASLLLLSGVEVSIRLINCCTAPGCFPYATCMSFLCVPVHCHPEQPFWSPWLPLNLAPSFLGNGWLGVPDEAVPSVKLQKGFCVICSIFSLQLHTLPALK